MLSFSELEPTTKAEVTSHNNNNQHGGCSRVWSSLIPANLDPHENFWLGDWTEDVPSALTNWAQWHNEEYWADFDQVLYNELGRFYKIKPETVNMNEKKGHEISKQIQKKAFVKLVSAFQYSRNKSGNSVIKRIHWLSPVSMSMISDIFTVPRILIVTYEWPTCGPVPAVINKPTFCLRYYMFIKEI